MFDDGRMEIKSVQKLLEAEDAATAASAEGGSLSLEVRKLLSYKNPALILKGYNMLSEDDKNLYHAEIVTIISHEKAAESKLKAKNKKPEADYSKSFGGTAEDTRKEKEAAELMRGNDGEKEESKQSKMVQPTYFTTHFDERVLRVNGKWMKFDGGNCMMYINCLTKAISAMRPSEYEEEEVVAPKVEQVVDVLNGLPSCPLTDLTTFVDEHTDDPTSKTLLLLDTSPEQNVRTFYSYKAILEDVSSLTVPFAKAGIKRGDLIERCRKSLVGAIKTGGTFVLYLGSMTIEHANWKKKLCKKDIFPAETFQLCGRKLLETYMGKKRYESFFREEDLEAGLAIAREGFKFVVVSSLSPHEYMEALEESIPLGYMDVVVIT